MINPNYWVLVSRNRNWPRILVTGAFLQRGAEAAVRSCLYQNVILLCRLKCFRVGVSSKVHLFRVLLSRYAREKQIETLAQSLMFFEFRVCVKVNWIAIYHVSIHYGLLRPPWPTLPPPTGVRRRSTALVQYQS